MNLCWKVMSVAVLLPAMWAEEVPLERLLESARAAPPYERGIALAALGQRKDPKAVPVLKETLQAGPAGLRLQALDALAALGDRKAVLECVPPLLGDPNPSIRHAGTLALASHVAPADTVVLEALAKCLKDEARQVRQAAIEVFLKLDTAGARFLVAALSDPDEGLRQRALAAFAKHPAPDGVPALLELARSKTTGHRLGSLEALVVQQDPRALPLFEAAFSDKEPQARAAAIRAAAAPWTEGKLENRAISALSSDPEPAVREAAATALAAMGKNPAARPMLISLALFEDEALSVRLKAVAALAALGDAPLLPFIQLLAANENAKLKEAAIAAEKAIAAHLAAATPPAEKPAPPQLPAPFPLAAEEAERLLKHEDALIRLLAVQAPAFQSAAPKLRLRVFSALEKALEDPNPYVARAAERSIERLLQSATSQDKDLLLNVSRNQGKRMRALAFQALGRSLGVEALPLLQKALKDREPEVSEAAAEAIRKLAEQKVPLKPALIEALIELAGKRPEAKPRTPGPAEAPKPESPAGETGPGQAIEATSYQARGALRALAGHDFRFDTQRWTDWLRRQGDKRGQTLPLHPVEGTLGEEVAFEPLGKLLLPYGRALDVAVRGDWAYVATGEGGIALYDLSAPASPNLADRYVTFVPGHFSEGHGWARDSNGVCSQLTLSGDRLYFIARHSGFAMSGVELTVLDISQPGKLRRLGGFPPLYASHAHASIAVRDTFVYSIQGQSLVIYDLSDAQQPKQAGIFQAQAPLTAVACAGAFILVGEGENGLRALDLSQPSSPQIRGLYPEAGKVTALLVQGDQVAVGTEKKGLHLLKLQPDGTLVQPRVVALDSPVTALAPGPKSVFVSTPAGLRVLDLADLAQPKLLPGTDAIKGSRIAAWRDGVAVADASVGLRLYAADGQSWQVRGEALGYGEAADMEIRDSLAFVAAGTAGLLVLDLKSPDQPRFLGRVPLEGYAHRILLADNRAFVAAGAGGLAILDLADPRAPKLPRQVPVKAVTETEKAEIRGVWMEANTAYLAVDRAGLVIADITDLGQPRRLAQLQFPDERAGPRSLEVHKGIAYLASGRAGLYLIDVSNPAQPRQLGWFWDEEGCRRMATWDVHVRGSVAYLADADLGLLTIDVAKPAAPRLLGRFNTGDAHQAALLGNLAFIADGGYGLRAVDVSDPANPRHKGSFHDDRVFFKSLRFLDENTVAVAGAWELRTFRLAALKVPLRTAFSLRPDGAPRPLQQYDKKPLAPEAVSQRYGIDVALFDGDQDVCAEGYPDSNSPGHRLRPVPQDLSDASGWPNVRVKAGAVAIDPKLGRVKFSDGDREPCRLTGWAPLPMGICHSLRLQGNHVFMSDEEGWNIVIWDISNPLKPVRKGLACTGGFCIGSLWVQGNLVIGGNNMGRFTIFDVSNVERPVPIGWFPGNARCVVASGHYAFDISGHLVAWDISNPGEPKKAAAITDGSMGFHMSGSFANPQVMATDKYIIGSGGPGLRVVDVSNMPNLKVLAEHAIPVKCLDIKGDRLYVGDGSTVRIFDFADPKRPVLLGRCSLPQGFNAITVDGDYLYAAGWALQVVNVSDPAAPHLTGACGQVNFITGNTHQNIVMAVVAKGNAVYTAQPGWGLSVFDVADKTNPKALLGDPLQTLAMGGDFTGIYVRGNFAFSANNWSGVKVVDISDPTNPRHIFNTKLYDSGASLGVAANDDLFIYNSSVTGNMVFDYSDPKNIRDVGRPQPQPQPPAGWGIAGGVHFSLRGNYAYGGGQVLDITYPLRAKVAGRFPGSCPGGLAGKHYFTSGTVVDVSQPEKPVVVGHSPAIQGSGWYGRGFYATERTVYSVTRGGLLIADVSDPAHPRFLAHLVLPHFPSDVWVQGDLAYVALYYGGVDILDIADPAHPKLVDHAEFGPFWDFGGWDNLVCYQSAAIDGEYLCTNEYYSGLHVIDVPTAPMVPKGKLTARVFPAP